MAYLKNEKKNVREVLIDSYLEMIDSYLEMIDSYLEMIDSYLEMIDSYLEMIDSYLCEFAWRKRTEKPQYFSKILIDISQFKC